MTNSEAEKLKGQENYIEWSKRFKVLAKIKKWGRIEGNLFVPKSEVEEAEAFAWILGNVADEAIQPIDADKGLSENLKILNDTFGYGRLNPISQQQMILDYIEFSVTRNPISVF